MDAENKLQAAVVKVGLEWSSSDTLQTVFANQLYVTHAGGEFVLIFGEVMVPMKTTVEQFPSTVAIKPVAKIVLTAESMQMIVDVMNSNLGTYKQQRGTASDQ